jgi:hypothetical protein
MCIRTVYNNLYDKRIYWFIYTTTYITRESTGSFQWTSLMSRFLRAKRGWVRRRSHICWQRNLDFATSCESQQYRISKKFHDDVSLSSFQLANFLITDNCYLDNGPEMLEQAYHELRKIIQHEWPTTTLQGGHEFNDQLNFDADKFLEDGQSELVHVH